MKQSPTDGVKTISVKRLPLSRYRIDFAIPEDHYAFKLLFRSLTAILGFGRISRIAKKAYEDLQPGESIFCSYLRHCGIDVEVHGYELSAIPATGPVVFVANHPTGMPDPFIVGSVIETRIRHDLKVLGYRPLCDLPGVEDKVIPIHLPSPSGRGRPDMAERLARARADARQHLQAGGSILVFPAGRGTRLSPEGVAIDGAWRHGAFALAAKTGAKVVPVFIEAKGSPFRAFLLRLHPSLYLVAGPKDLMYLRGKTVRLTFGDPDSGALKEALSVVATAPDRVREVVFGLPSQMLPSDAKAERAVRSHGC